MAQTNRLFCSSTRSIRSECEIIANDLFAVPFPTDLVQRRSKRQTDQDDIPLVDGLPDGVDVDATQDVEDEQANLDGLTIQQNCEEWPVQKCRLEKRKMTKVHPDTACRKIPREVCIPNNCEMVPGAKVCREETIVKVQNVPQEDCELQPEENCFMEAVMVPK